MTQRVAVKLTANFERNLRDIEQFVADADQTNAFDVLLTELTETVIPNLERFPAIGSSLFNRPIRSIEVASASERVLHQLKALDPQGELREYVMTNYLVLYAQLRDAIYLLSIRHHRQISFDFEGLWRG